MQPQQIEGRHDGEALVVRPATTPSWTHPCYNTFWPFNGYMNGSGGFPFLFVRPGNSSNTETKVRTKALTYSMRHSTGSFFTDRTILFNDFVRDTHLLFDFDTIRRHSTNEVFRTNRNICNGTGQEPTCNRLHYSKRLIACLEQATHNTLQCFLIYAEDIMAEYLAHLGLHLGHLALSLFTGISFGGNTHIYSISFGVGSNGRVIAVKQRNQPLFNCRFAQARHA